MSNWTRTYGDEAFKYAAEEMNNGVWLDHKRKRRRSKSAKVDCHKIKMKGRCRLQLTGITAATNEPLPADNFFFPTAKRLRYFQFFGFIF